MSSLLTDHIWALLIAFIAALGCYTAVAIIGGNGQVLEQVVVGLGGAMGGFATAKVASK